MEFETEESPLYQTGDSVLLFGQRSARFEEYVGDKHARVTAVYPRALASRGSGEIEYSEFDQTVSLSAVSRG